LGDEISQQKRRGKLSLPSHPKKKNGKKIVKAAGETKGPALVVHPRELEMGRML